MYKVCPRLAGYNEDVYNIPSDDNPQTSTSYVIQITGSTRDNRHQMPSLSEYPNS